MTKQEAQKAIAGSVACTAIVNKQPFVCWIESIHEHKGREFASVRTMKGRKQTVPIEDVAAVRDCEIGGIG